MPDPPIRYISHSSSHQFGCGTTLMEGKTKRQRKRANGRTQENERRRQRMVERQMSELKEA